MRHPVGLHLERAEPEALPGLDLVQLGLARQVVLLESALQDRQRVRRPVNGDVVSCQQVGPIVLPEKLPKEASVFSDSTSLVWKNTKVIRMYDARRNALVYVAISKRLIEGSPMNAVSAVPVTKW